MKIAINELANTHLIKPINIPLAPKEEWDVVFLIRDPANILRLNGVF